MRATNRLAGSRHGGFTLIELMVGMAIGMIATIIIVQVMSVFEAQKRTTTGSADAQTNGGIALYSIAREVQLGGFPMMPISDSALECTAMTYGATGITGGFAPVTITEVAAVANVSPATDTIVIRYGSSAMGGVPAQITSMSGSEATVSSSLGCAVGDISMASSGSTCEMSTVTAVATTAPNKITLQNAGIVIAGFNLGCMGAWHEVTYEAKASDGNLYRTDKVNGAGTPQPSVVGVVNVQAQYGIAATANSNVITRWVNPRNIADLEGASVDGASTGVDWGSGLTIPNRNRIKAIRVAVVARNAKKELDDVSSACSSLITAAPDGLCAWGVPDATSPAPKIDLSTDANWKKYRYRVYETIIPLRNVIWSKDTL